MSAFIIGTGSYLPERVVTNEEIAERLGLQPEQIYKSSGIRRRRWAAAKTPTSDLAVRALESALENASLDAAQIDYLIFGTMTPDRFIPGSAPAVQKRANLRDIPCLDIRATCCNALYALQLAQSLIKAKTAQHVAICLAEVQSAWLDLTPQSGTTSMLFGDGAAALIVGGEKNDGALEVLDVYLATDGSFVDDLGIRCPGTEYGVANGGASAEEDNKANSIPRMVGQSVIIQASRKLTAACQIILERHNLTASDVKWLVPHQANTNLLMQVARNLRFPTDGGELINVLEDYGNTSSASMGIALDTLRRSNRIAAGDNLLLPAFGAGFTWGAALCRA